jgi:sugar lactone lactonase YvrE
MTHAHRALDAERLIDVTTVLGEGPVWDADRQVLSWVDIMPGHVHVCSAAGEILRSYELGRAVGAALPDGEGGFLLADAHGFRRLADLHSAARRFWCERPDSPTTEANRTRQQGWPN